MTRQRILEQLKLAKPVLAERFGVTNLALFGSSARDTARSDSDIDILISFDGPATSPRYFGVQFYLENLLGQPVDLVTQKALRPEFRPFVEQELIHVGPSSPRLASLPRRHDPLCWQSANLHQRPEPRHLHGKRSGLRRDTAKPRTYRRSGDQNPRRGACGMALDPLAANCCHAGRRENPTRCLGNREANLGFSPRSPKNPGSRVGFIRTFR